MEQIRLLHRIRSFFIEQRAKSGLIYFAAKAAKPNAASVPAPAAWESRNR
jgi:hypothetical protein